MEQREVDLSLFSQALSSNLEATNEVSNKPLHELVSVTADNIFLRVPTDEESKSNTITPSGIITGYKLSKAEMHYDVLAVGPSVVRCEVGDKVVVEAHKLNSPIGRTVGEYVFFTVRDFDILAVIK